MPIVLKSGSLNLLEPSGPVQACNGIALPFTESCMVLVVSLQGAHEKDVGLIIFRAYDVNRNFSHHNFSKNAPPSLYQFGGEF